MPDWLSGAIGAIIVAVAGGCVAGIWKLLEMRKKRKYDKEDEKESFAYLCIIKNMERSYSYWGWISQADWGHAKVVYKKYLKLGGDTNGHVKIWMDTLEELYKKSKGNPPEVSADIEKRKPVVLAIDDSSTWTYLVSKALGQDCEVHTSNDPKEVRSLLQQFSPDLLIVDNLMPGIDGLELVESIRRYPGYRRTPIVMLTGSEDVGQAAKDAGVDELIIKPFDEKELRDIVALYMKG